MACCRALSFSVAVPLCSPPSWLKPEHCAGCALQAVLSAMGPLADLSEPPHLGQGTVSQKGNSGDGNGVIMTVRKSLHGQKGLLAATIPKSRGVCRIQFGLCIPHQNHRVPAWCPAPSQCLSYTTELSDSDFRHGRNRKRHLFVLYFDCLPAELQPLCVVSTDLAVQGAQGDKKLWVT